MANMAITGSIRVGTKVYGPGDEDAFLATDPAPEAMARLRKAGAIDGRPLLKVFDQDEIDTGALPKVSDLPKVLSRMNDIQDIRDMAASDPRKMAKQHYNARIVELL